MVMIKFNYTVFKTCLTRDMVRYGHSTFKIAYLLNPVYRQLFLFRLGQNAENILFQRIIRIFLTRIAFTTGIQLEITTRVGAGLCFPHHGTIVINSSAKIGENVTIFQGVTLGFSARKRLSRNRK